MHLGYSSEHSACDRSVEGTAFSAAEVAGVAATILEKKPDLTPVQLREHILQNYTTFIGKEARNSLSLTAFFSALAYRILH